MEKDILNGGMAAVKYVQVAMGKKSLNVDIAIEVKENAIAAMEQVRKGMLGSEHSQVIWLIGFVGMLCIPTNNKFDMLTMNNGRVTL